MGLDDEERALPLPGAACGPWVAHPPDPLSALATVLLGRSGVELIEGLRIVKPDCATPGKGSWQLGLTAESAPFLLPLDAGLSPSLPSRTPCAEDVLLAGLACCVPNRMGDSVTVLNRGC